MEEVDDGSDYSAPPSEKSANQNIMFTQSMQNDGGNGDDVDDSREVILTSA